MLLLFVASSSFFPSSSRKNQVAFFAAHRWHRVALSAKAQTLTLLVDCETVDQKAFNRTLRDLDVEGEVYLLHESDSKVYQVRKNLF